ncbi:MAG: gliding motility-associated protein GldE [Chitinophagales bacterium]|nr:gliding motility-associated protein GldE [Chitinophagales bacterium]
MDSSSPVPLEPDTYLTSIVALGSFDIYATLSLYCLGIILLVILSGLIASAEIALFSISQLDKKELEKKIQKKDGIILTLLDSPRALLSTILFTNFIIYALLAFLGISISNELLQLYPIAHLKSVVYTSVFVAIFLIKLIFGEIGPKIFASQNNLSFAKKTIIIVYILNGILKPFTFIFLKLSSYLEERIEKYDKIELAEELDQALDSHISTSLHQELGERNLLKGIVKFGNIYVTQVMRSRMDVVWVDISLNFHELLDTVRDSGYSRIPVCNGDFDHTLGIIYAKDLLSYLDEKEDFNWHSLIKTALFIPESKKIDSLLEEFQIKRIHMAIVVDEYGGASGLVTMEDILEEVIGEIKDEFDDIHEIDFRKIDNNNYIFEGKTSIYDVCKILNISTNTFEDIGEGVDTLAGIILEIKGELPVQGEEIELKDFTFKVMETNATRIVRVKITMHES